MLDRNYMLNIKDNCVQWIRDYFAENGPDCNAIVGISGGKDSSVVAALCVEALGALDIANFHGAIIDPQHFSVTSVNAYVSDSPVDDELVCVTAVFANKFHYFFLPNFSW